MDAALRKFFKAQLPPPQGRTLIVGSAIKPGREDRRKAYKDALGLDLEAGEGVDLVHDLIEPLSSDLEGTFVHAECTSVLEHCRRPWKLAENLERALRVGGTLLLSVPFVWRVHAYPSDYFRFTVDGVRELFPRIRWDEILYSGVSVTESSKRALQAHRVAGHPFMARCEVYGFGVRE